MIFIYSTFACAQVTVFKVFRPPDVKVIIALSGKNVKHFRFQ